MPFTFAHPAAALPLLRPLGRYGSLSALAIGSIAPDLTFIVPLPLSREQTHGLAALFLFCLPAGALVYFLFHALFKAPLIALLPAPIAHRVAPSARPVWPAVLVSLLCGAATHVLWDAFTHPGTPIVNALPWLQRELGNIGGYRLYGFKLLQHAGSVLGMAVLVLWMWRWLHRAPPASVRPDRVLTRAQRKGAIAALIAAPLLAGLIAGWWRVPVVASVVDLQVFAGGFIFSALPAGAVMLTLYSALWQLARRCLPQLP